MPCSDNRDDGFNYTKAMAKMEFQADLDKLTRMLCEAMGFIDYVLEDDKYVEQFNPSKELVQWWKEHQELDKKRKS